jgi:hypothetical protein
MEQYQYLEFSLRIVPSSAVELIFGATNFR